MGLAPQFDKKVYNDAGVDSYLEPLIRDRRVTGRPHDPLWGAERLMVASAPLIPITGHVKPGMENLGKRTILILVVGFLIANLGWFICLDSIAYLPPVRDGNARTRRRRIGGGDSGAQGEKAPATPLPFNGEPSSALTIGRRRI